jgi:hypothetical protein
LSISPFVIQRVSDRVDGSCRSELVANAFIQRLRLVAERVGSSGAFEIQLSQALRDSTARKKQFCSEVMSRIGGGIRRIKLILIGRQRIFSISLREIRLRLDSRHRIALTELTKCAQPVLCFARVYLTTREQKSIVRLSGCGVAPK